MPSLQSQLDRATTQLDLQTKRLQLEQARMAMQAIKRRKRMFSSYDGAKRDRRDTEWSPRNVTADQAIILDLPILIARARAMCRDNPHARSIVRSFSRNVVGRGIAPSATARFKRGRERATFNKSANELFWAWADNPKLCDVEGRKTFWQFQRLIVEERVQVGEGIVLMVDADNGFGQVPLRLQAIESEQLDETKRQHGPNEIRGGVEVDAFGRAVAYWIRTRETAVPGTMANGLYSVRVPAERVLHLFRQERVGQTRGVTELATVLRKLRDLGEYDALELWTARMQACFGLFLKRPGGLANAGFAGMDPGSSADEEDAQGNRDIHYTPGMVIEGEPGEEAQFLTPSRPANGYDPFVKAQLKAIGAGVDLSYPQVARDFSDGNFSSQRQTLLEDRRSWRPFQDDLIYGFCKPVRDRFILLAVLRNLLSAPAFFQNAEAFCACDWQPDGWEWIDPANAAAAAKIAIEQKIDTRGRILNELGRNVREEFEQLAIEQDMADEFGIALPENAAGGTTKNPHEPDPQGVAPVAEGAGSTEPTSEPAKTKVEAALVPA